jgi:hypothetical protein
MTTQHQIIAICVIVFIAVPVGCFTTIKCINKLTRVPVFDKIYFTNRFWVNKIESLLFLLFLLNS